MQLDPAHPMLHLQSPGDIQVPPLKHPCAHIATKIFLVKIISHAYQLHTLVYY